jgi:hypothetical protein
MGDEQKTAKNPNGLPDLESAALCSMPLNAIEKERSKGA